jgi:hypothetical protein
MEQLQQRKLDSLRRVQDFLEAIGNGARTINDSDGRRQLDEAVTALVRYADEQAVTELAMKGLMARQRSQCSALRTSHMKPIAIFARAKLRDVPDFAALVKSGRGLQPKQLVRAARAMAAAGASQADLITRGGFPPDTIAQLAAAASELETTLLERAGVNVRRVGSTVGVREELIKGREAVRMLDAVVTKRFADDETFLAAWCVARRVTAKPGAAQLSVSPATVTATTAPEASVAESSTAAGDQTAAVQLPSATRTPSIVSGSSLMMPLIPADQRSRATEGSFTVQT